MLLKNNNLIKKIYVLRSNTGKQLKAFVYLKDAKKALKEANDERFCIEIVDAEYRSRNEQWNIISGYVYKISWKDTL